MNTELDMYSLTPFRYILIPNYMPGESVVLALGHHACIDGVKFFSMLQSYDIEGDFSQLPRVTPPSFW